MTSTATRTMIPVSDTLNTPDLRRHVVPAAGASVMGTGIVGIAAHTLPVRIAGLGLLADCSWVLAAMLLAGVLTLHAGQVIRHPEVSKAHLLDIRTAPAMGTMAMAFLTVGTATLLVGAEFLGASPALRVDVTCYALGTALGLATTIGFPLLLVTRRDRRGLVDVSATWLLAVVPPMVSSASGGIIAQHLEPGQTRNSLIIVSLLLFGMSFVAAFLMLALLWTRLLLHGGEPLAATPALWVVLGPLGQGATALGAIALAGKGSLPTPYPTGLAVVALVGGAGLLGVAAMWAVLATVMTVRAARQRFPFHLGWWSFTFPVGTCVTGVSALATRTDLAFLKVASVGAFVILAAAWLVVVVGTARGVWNGSLVSPLAAPAA